MIVGLGVDITEVDRIEAAIGRRGRAFLQETFSLRRKSATAKGIATAPNDLPDDSPRRKPR